MDESRLLDRPVAVRAGEELPLDRLQDYLHEHLPGADGSLSLEQFPSGYSNLTYLIGLGGRELVLRRAPHGAAVKAGHDMAREHRILTRLRPIYSKVPQALLFCDDAAVIGAPFYVMERVQGVILRTQPPGGKELEPGLMRGICEALIDTLVELHALDYQAAGLGDLGRPDGYVDRQVEGWIGRYERARTDEIRVMDELATWMRRNRPAHSTAALIHNDFKYDNVVLDPADLTRIRAVLDWEMATLGDPLTDVGTTLAYWAEPGDPGILQAFGLTSRPGNLDRRQWVERYAARSGADVTHILFYYVYGLFKNAVIVQQIYRRYRDGVTRDERFAGLIEMVRACSAVAGRAIDRDRIDHLY